MSAPTKLKVTIELDLRANTISVNGLPKEPGSPLLKEVAWMRDCFGAIVDDLIAARFKGPPPKVLPYTGPIPEARA